MLLLTILQKKCECYWPENINNVLEPGQGIHIILASITPLTEYTVRKMVVTKVSFFTIVVIPN